MSRDQRSLTDYIGDIVQASQNIQTYTAGMTETAFLNSGITKDAVIRNFEIIGEASRQLEKHYPEFVKLHPELPLQKAYDMRNQLVHGYFKTDYEIVWKTVLDDLPEFHLKVEAVHADQRLKTPEMPMSREMIEQAKALLQSTGTSSEFQDAVVKEMEARLNLDNGIKTSDVGKNERDH
jgi:uncharacterized protein with HEPN domain